MKVRFRLPEPTQRTICVGFEVDGIGWGSCFDGNPDQLNYERSYKLDAGNYQIWVQTEDGGQSVKRPVMVLESEPR